MPSSDIEIPDLRFTDWVRNKLLKKKKLYSYKRKQILIFFKHIMFFFLSFKLNNNFNIYFYWLRSTHKLHIYYIYGKRERCYISFK